MGQCVSRGHPGSYAFSRHYDSQSLSSISNSGCKSWGHSGSKGARKRDKSAGANGNAKPSRGVATSFGFRRRPASSSRLDDNSRRKHPHDSNGNRGSTEDLRQEEILSGRSTPLARPRKEQAVQQLRTNRFGCRQPALSKTAKVGDVTLAVEEAFSISSKDTVINNNETDKKSTNLYQPNPLYPTARQVCSTTTTAAAAVPKNVTKQTIILTYQPQKYSAQESCNKIGVGMQGARSSSVTRNYAGGELDSKAPGKYTFQSTQLPRPQYPAVKNVDLKSVKQVANNTRKIGGSSEGWREGTGSAVSSDSGVYSCRDGRPEYSPTSRRRPRNLEMVMKGAHSFHLRELQVADLDIMDDAVVTGHAVIPLPKLPSSFDQEDEDQSPVYEKEPTFTFKTPSPVAPITPPHTTEVRNPMSTLERYRTRTRPSRIQTNLTSSKEEEKFVLDRAQPEILQKQNSFIKSSSRVVSVSSSKESSPSCKSDESHFSPSTTETWQGHAAGEAMATRSQDDVSLALSVSSCDEDKSKQENRDYQSLSILEKTKKTILIVDEPPAPHPLLMKTSLTLSQNDSYRAVSMMGSMNSSNYSTTSTCTNHSAGQQNLTLTMEETKYDLSALEISSHSLIDDETSPVDSLISSTSTSGSNNDLHIDREPPSISSSAYQTANTANTKSKSPEPDLIDDEIDGEVLNTKDIINVDEFKTEHSKNSPESPGTPTHASGSLSLSDGRDFFDDEIADQPALLFRKNTDRSPTKKVIESATSKLRKSREHINNASPLLQRNRRMGGSKAELTASLDTLSSLASDDMMMMDNELGQSITSLQSVDDYIERLDSSLRSGLNSLDERQLQRELSSKTAVRQWSQLLEQSNQLDQQLAAVAQGTSSHSLSTSTTSLTNIGASLPVRTARLLQRSRAQTPADAPEPASASLLQDVVDIKTLLLQLKRVLQEPGEEHNSTSSETLDPLLAVCAESPARANGRPPPAAPLHPDACNEMKRQIIFLQSQLEERDRLVKVLQQQMHKMSASHDARDDTCSVATQTDRLRLPTSTNGMATSENGLVSWNEHTNGRRLQMYGDQTNKRQLSNGSVPIKCTCGASKVNGVYGQEPENDRVQLKINSRVGSKYIQAVTTNNENRRYIKRDTSVGEKTARKSLLYSNRSRSIENFQNHPFSTKDTWQIKEAKENKEESTQVKHHTSYGDLYNGRISSKESVNGNRHSPSLNGQSTDTDYSSDGGYKSLPSTINYNGNSPKKISGIPRRSLEQRFLTTKHVKASAV